MKRLLPPRIPRMNRLAPLAYALFVAVAVLAPACHPLCDDEPRFGAGSGVDVSALTCRASATCATASYCLHVPDTFDGFEKDMVLDAAADWSTSLGHAVDVSCASGSVDISFAKTTDDDPFLKQSHEDYARGFAVGNTVYLDMDHLCGSRMYHAVLRHELGHLLGLPHSANPESIMYGTYSIAHANTSVRNDDVESYQTVHACCVAH